MADPRKYRDEAKRLREEATATAHVETRETMLTIAQLYERLADTLTKQRQGDTTGGPHTFAACLRI
jgi:hypothetical protein